MKKLSLLVPIFLNIQLICLAQNVGIGEASPANRLEIKGASVDPLTGALLVKNSVNDTLFRISNSGQLGIGTSSSSLPTYRLRLHSTDNGNFIHLTNPSSGKTESNGATIGIYDQNMYLHNLNNGYMSFRTSNLERIRIAADGNVGIGVANPEFMLDVNGRARLRSNGLSAGLWFNNSSNSSAVGFVGMFNDNTMGLWGTGVGWTMLTNTSNGNTAFGGTPDNNIRLLTQSNNIALYTGGSSTSSTAIKLGTGKVSVEGAGINTPTTVFVHKANDDNTVLAGANPYTVIDNPYCNNDPNAILIVTLNGTYGSGTGIGYNDIGDFTHSFFVFYMSAGNRYFSSAPLYARNKWCIRMTMDINTVNPIGFNFNTMIVKPN